MSDSMIERVAKAMQLETVNKPFSWENAAWAAINAMREPTPEMTESPSYLNGEWSRRSCEAMIDAALNGQ